MFRVKATQEFSQDPVTKRDQLSYLETYEFPRTNDISKYQPFEKLGQGRYGDVFRARHNNTRQTVALKRVLMDSRRHGIPTSFIVREIQYLKLLKHENIVSLIEVCGPRGYGSHKCRNTLYLVLEFCEHTLTKLIFNPVVNFSNGLKRCLMNQLMLAVSYLHRLKIMHRDLKPDNILVTKNRTLKLADFGLARGFEERTMDHHTQFTTPVVTLWYRSPELLLGERNYGPAVDMWSVGCIMAELWTRRPLLQGKTELEQISLISYFCGSINPQMWPGVDNIGQYHNIQLPQGQPRKVKNELKLFVNDPYALDLIDKLMVLDPSKRIVAEESLNHEYFCVRNLSSDIGGIVHSEEVPSIIALQTKKEDRFSMKIRCSPIRQELVSHVISVK